ncbi:TetR/AcrR family transcriptional regulator [Penaeicola halotolerans]|uniref:TetR/AcrR family transcriptional regulator n=1 Tax=Penaeicola halotolerans TaxID=2793196 RepID=UPI001CF91507|nr:TetR/AcrR family transcriptional regulator [Penaeicola halotolerans]
MNDKKKELLDLAEELILTRGYNAFSFQDLSDKVGIKKASIHYHFPTKEKLGLALINRYMEEFKDWTKKLDDQKENAAVKIEGFFQNYQKAAMGEKKISLGGILSAEFNTLSEEMQESLKLYFNDRYKWLVKTINDGQYEGSLRVSGAAEDKAYMLLAALQGALQIARATKNREMFLQISRELKNQLVNGK